MPSQYFEIGDDYAGLVNVETLTDTPNMAPAARYLEYTETIRTGDGGAFGRGSPVIEWAWAGFMPADLFDELRKICPGASAPVMIRTRTERGDETDPDDYTYYECIMLWPDLTSYDYRAGQYSGVTIRFVHPVEYDPPS
jgi:hypothetical protein